MLGVDQTYATSIALAGLSGFQNVNAAVPAAIVAGRAYLVNEFQAPPNTTCATGETDRTSSYCGGWNYEPEFGRSDESDTGFAMFGLQETGGVPAAIQAVNVPWQYNVQADQHHQPALRR